MKNCEEGEYMIIEENLFVLIPKSERYKVKGYFDLDLKGEAYARLLGDLTKDLCDVALKNEKQGHNFVIVPILRAGKSMSSVVEKRLLEAEVAQISMRRNLKTLKPFVAWDEFENISHPHNKKMIITDPALATGGSILKTLERAINYGFKEDNIIIMSMFGWKGGIEKIISTYPKIKIYLVHMADGIREDGYLLPYNGDTGDRLYGERENEFII